MPDREALRRAAIIVATLDRQSADAMLDRMSPEKAEAIRRTILSLHDVDDREEEGVLREFLSTDRLEGGDPRGATAPWAEADNHHPLPPPVTPGDRGLATALEQFSDEALVGFLQYERVQTIAVLLARLPRPRAARVIALLGRDRQWEVVRALASSARASHEVIEEIEREIESWLGRNRREAPRNHTDLDQVQEILGGIAPPQQQQLLEDLARQDPLLANQLGWQS
jgi:flagellar motor switch protein FliG